MERKIYECVCGKRLSYDEVRAHSLVCPKINRFESSLSHNDSVPFTIDELLLKYGIKPAPKNRLFKSLHQPQSVTKRISYRSSIVFGTLFVSIGLSFLFGFSKYWPIIIIALILAFIFPLPKRK